MLSNLSLTSDATFAVNELRLENKILTLNSVSSFTVANELVLDNANERIIWDENSAVALNGGLKLDPNGEFAWKDPVNLTIGDISLNGGVLELGENVSQTFALASNLTLTADSEMIFNSGSILNYSGAEIMLGNELSFSGIGQLQNTNALNLGTNGKLKLSGISIANVISSADSLGMEIENNSTVSSLTVSNLLPVSITSSKSLSGNIVVNTGGTLQFSNSGTLAANVLMSGGTLDANESLTISGALTQSGDISIDVDSGKTLTFGSGEIKTGSYQLTLEGAGIVAFPENASGIVLNNSDGLLKLNGTGTLQSAKVSTASNEGKGILIDDSGTISKLNIAADTELNIAAGKTLSGSTDVAQNTSLKLSGAGTFGSTLNLEGTLEAGTSLMVSGTINVADNVTVLIPDAGTTLSYSGGNLTVQDYTLTIGGAGTFSNAVNSPIVLVVEESVLDLTGNGIISGAIRLEGCTLKASGSPTISGDIGIFDDANIEVVSGKTLNYSGASLKLGANKLTMSGGGIFNNSNVLELDHADSLLVLAGINTVGNVKSTSVANSGKGVQVTESVTLGNFEMTATTILDIAANKTIDGQIKLNNNSELKISGSGEYTGGMELAGGKFSVANDKNLTGTLSLSADSEMNVAPNSTLIIQQGGDFSLNEKILSLRGNGSLKFQNSINVQDGELKVSNGTLDFADGGSVDELTLESATLVLGGDLTIGDKLTTSGNDPTLQLNGSSVDLSGTNVKLELGTGLSLDGVITGTNTALLLSADATLSRGSPFTLGSIDLQNKALSLASETSDMTVTGALTFDTTASQMLTGGADITLQSALALADGKLSSTSGILTLQQGAVFGNGAVFDFSGSTVKLSGTLDVADGTLNTNNSSKLELQTASSFSSNAVFTIPTLDLNGQGLTLNTSSTHLTLSNLLTVGSDESINTQSGSMTLNDALSLNNNGKLESSAGALIFNGSVALDDAGILMTGGSVAFNSAAQISGGELKLFNSTLTLAADVAMSNSSTLRLKDTAFSVGSSKITLTGGTLEFGGTYSDFSKIQTDSNTALKLNADTNISTSSAMIIGGLDLNNFELTLGSETTDLTIQSILKLDNSGSKLTTNQADLSLPYPLELNAGKITSSGGTFTLTQGGTLGTNATLDVSGTTLKLNADLAADSGTLTTNDTSILDLLDDVILTFNGEKTFKALEHNGKILSLGSSTSDLKLLDPLNLSAVTLHTGDADLNLQGTLTLAANSVLDSTGGTLKLGGSVDSTSEISLPGTELALRSNLAIAGTLSTDAGSTISRNTRELNLSGGKLILGGDLDLGGTVTDDATSLTLQTDSTLGNSLATKFGTLDLNGSALSITMATTINDPFTLDASGEQLLTGASDLTLNNQLELVAGKLSSQSGVISFGSTVNLGSAGTIDIQGGELKLSDNISITGGTLTLAETSELNLINDVTISSNRALSFGTLEMNNRNLTVTATEGADLTLKKAFTLNNGSTLQMSGADLSFAETATIAGILEPSGGRLTFQKGGSVSGTVNSKNSTLALQTANLVFSGLLQTNGSTGLSGANWLNLSNGRLETAGSLTLDDVATSNGTVLKLTADTTISRDSLFTLGSVNLAGNSLTLGSATTDLTINNSAPTEGESAGTFKIQEADLTWTGAAEFSTAKVYASGGTLTLSGGSSLSANGLISLSSGSTLILVGTFGQSGGELTVDAAAIQTGGNLTKTGGSLTSSNSSLELTDDVTFSSDSALSFKAVTLNNNVLSLAGQSSSFTLSEELTLNNPNGRIVQDSTSLILTGGVSIDSGAVLRLTKDLDTGTAKIKLNGGLLAIESSTTLNSSIEHLAASTIEIAETKTLTYEGATIKVGPFALSIGGGGSYSNTNPLELDNAASQLKLSAVTANYVRTSADSLGLVVENESTVNELTVGHLIPVSISENQSLSGEIEVFSNGNLQLNNSGTLAANVTMKGDAFGAGTVGGKLDVQQSLTFSGSLLQAVDHKGIELTIASGKTLTYSGSEIGVGDHEFKLSGGGTFANTSKLELDDSGSKLSISDSTIISLLSVSTAATAVGLNITDSDVSATGNIVENLYLSDSFSVTSDTPVALGNITAAAALTFSSNKDVNSGTLALTGGAELSLGTENVTVRVTSPVTVDNTQKLSNGGGSFDFAGGLNLEPGSALVGQGQQISGDIALNGGNLSIEQSTVLVDNLVQSADSTININSSQTLTYSGTTVDLSTSKLNIQGGGNFINTAASALSLNNSNSHLVLDNVVVGYVSVSAASGSNKGLDVISDATLSNLNLTEKLRLSVASEKTFSITESLTVPTQGMELSGSGMLELNENFTLNGDVILTSGSLTVDAKGVLLNLGGDFNLTGGVLQTDVTTNFHLLRDSTLTTNAEQLIANVTIAENVQPMLTLGSTTKLKVDELISVGISCPQSLPVEPKGQLKLPGGVSINTGGEFCIDGWLEGNIVLNGGTLRIDGDMTISSSSSISLNASSNLKIVDGASLTYEGAALNLNDSILSISGGGSLLLNTDGSNPLTLNNADGGLEFSGAGASTVSHVKTSSGDNLNAPVLKMTGSGVINNLAHTGFSEINYVSGKTLSITEAFEVPTEKELKISGAAGTLTLGDNMTLSGTLNLPIANTTLSGGTVTLNGGTLQVYEDINFISDLAQQADSSIVVADGKTLNYSGNEFNLGAQTLILSGSGNFANTTNITLNDPSSSLKFNGIAKVNKVSVSAVLTSGKLEIVQDSIIESLSHSGSSMIEIANAKTLMLKNTLEIPQAKSLELSGSGGGTLSLNEKLTLKGTLKVSAADTVKDGTLSLSGGTLEVVENAGILSTLLHKASSEVNVSSGKVLTYSGSAMDIGGFALTLSGGGKFANSADLKFNDVASVLNLAGITEVSKVSFPVSLQTGKLNVSENTLIQSLTHTGESIINISSGKTLSIKEDFSVSSNKTMLLNGSGGSLKLENTLTLNGTLQMDEESRLEGGTLAFDSGIVSVKKDSTISSSITHPAASTFEIASGKRLTLQGDLSVPAERKMNLTGSNGVLELEDTLTVSGTMEFAVPQTLDNGTIVLNGGKLSVNDDVAISAIITHNADSTVNISSGATLTHSGGDFKIGAKTLTLSGGGTFANQDQLVLDDPVSILKLDGISAVANVSVPLTLTTGKLEVVNNAGVQNLLHSGSSVVDILSGKTLSISNGFEIPQTKVMQFVGAGGTLAIGDNLTLSGTLKFPVSGVLSGGTVFLSGGKFDVDENLTIESNMVHSANATIEIATGKSINYTGQEFNLEAFKLIFSGGGTFNNTNNLSLNHAQSKLQLDGIKISKVAVKTELSDGVINVAENSTIDSLTQSASFSIELDEGNNLTLTNPFEIPAGKSMELLGSGAGRTIYLPDALKLSGNLKISSAGYSLTSGVLGLNGGLLDVLENTNIAATITQLSSSSIAVAADKTLTYSGNTPKIGAFTLTLSGSGTITNENAITLNDASSQLVLKGINQISKVAVTGELTSGMLSVDNDTLIQTLSHTGSSRFDISNDTTLTVQNLFEVPQNKSMELVGADNGTLVLGDQLTLSGILKFSAPDTLSDGTLALNGGTLSISENAIINSKITHLMDSAISVFADKTLKYTGDSPNVGALALTLSGEGKIENIKDIALDDPLSVLVLNGVEVSRVSFPEELSTGKLSVTGDSLIETLTQNVSSRLDIASGVRLTLENTFEIPEATTMELIGSGSGSLGISDTLTLSGEIKFNAPDSSLDNGTLALNGGTLTSSENTTVSSDITHLLNSTIDVSADKILSYFGSDLEIGALTLTMSGGGSFNNSTELSLNNAASVLKLDGIAKVEKVAVAEDLIEGSIDVIQNVTINTISPVKSTRIDIANSISLTLTDSVEVPMNKVLELQGSGGGILNISDKLTLSGTLKLNATNNTLNNGTLIFNNGLLDVDENVTISTQLSLADNASMDLANGKQLSLTKTFEIPQDHKLEILGSDGGTLSITDTLKLAGTLQFSAPTISSGTPYHNMINGKLELIEGSLLDVDYKTKIASDILISGNSSVDVAQGVNLEYSGLSIDITTFQLTLLGSGTLLNSNSILLSSTDSLLVFADDITIALIEVTANSTAGKGIRVESANAKITNLNLLADVGLSFTNESFELNVENLNVYSTAKIMGDGNGGWLLVTEVTQPNDVILTLQDVNVKVENEIDINFKDQIVMTGSTVFDVGGGLTFNVSGTMNFNRSMTANINLNGGVMCVTENVTINGKIQHLTNSTIFIAPDKVLTYEGSIPLEVNDLSLALQGGGRFSSWDNNSIRLNKDGGILKLADDATTLSHLGIDPSDGLVENDKVLVVDVSADSSCEGDDSILQSSAKIVVEQLDQKGNINLELSVLTELNTPNSFSVPSQKVLTVSGDSGQLTFGGTVTFEDESQFVLNSAGTKVSGNFDYSENNLLDAQESVTFQSSSSKWNNAQIKVDAGATLVFENNQWETQGALTKTGGAMSLDNVSWSLSENTNYSSDTAVETQSLVLNNKLLTLLTESSDLTVSDNITFDDSNAQLVTGPADLNLQGGFVMQDGLISSTKGIISFAKGGEQSGGSLDLTDSTFKLGADFLKSAGTLTATEAGTTLELTERLTFTSNTSLSVKTLTLNDKTLTLGSETTDLTVSDPTTLDSADEQIRTNSADLKLQGLLSVANGGLDSTGGTLIFNGGVSQTGGLLNISNSLLNLNADLFKTGGTLETSDSSLTVLSSLKITNNNLLSVNTIELGANTLTLGSESSDLTLSGNLALTTANGLLKTGDADLTVEGNVTLADGKLSSTGGTLLFRNGGTQSGTFEFDLGASTLSLSADYTKSGGNFDGSSAMLNLLNSIALSSDTALAFNQLQLNDLTLTLGSASTDLSVTSAMTFDNADEWLISGDADISFLAALNISDGGITSTGGDISTLGGGQLSGTGKLDLSGSTWVLGADFIKSSGVLTISQTDLKLAASSTLTSDEASNFVNLNLNDFTLTLGSATSDLTVENAVIIDSSLEGISTADADLILLSALSMSDGILTSTGGTLKLAHAQTSKFSGNALMMLDNTLLTSVDGNEIALLEIDGEPNLSMTDNSKISYITLSTTTGTVGTISTAGGVDCEDNCSGFTETGAYGFNAHGLYRNVVSANWMLSESEGERKTATMSVKLLSRPVSDVQVVLNSSDLSEATLDKYTMSFSPSTWNKTQTLIITGEDDSVVDDDVRVRIVGYTESTDTNYSSTSDSRQHAFKYTFTNINDDLQKGLSPIVQIGADQKVNEQTRVILDGSASYDPDPTGRIVSYKWKYVGQRTDVTVKRENESIAYFSAPDIEDTTVILFGLEVIDDDKTASYGSTSVTIVPVKEVTAIGSAVGSIKPKYPKDITLDAETTNSDGSKTLKLASGTTELNLDMNTDGTVVSKIKTKDGTESKVNVPLGAEVNMNKDASVSVAMTLNSSATLSTNISTEGEMTVGVSSGSTGANVKAPKGSEVSIGSDGTSSISLPASTDATSGVTSQVVSTLSPDGSTLTEITLSGGTGRTTNADSSESSKSSISTDAGLTVAIDTSSGVAASMSVTEGTLAASLLNDGTSSTSFDSGASKTTFTSSTSMDLQIKSGKVVSTSSAETGNDGVSRTIISTTSSTNNAIQVQGTGVSESTLQAATGSTILLSKNRNITSTFAPSSSMSSSVSMNSEGLMIPTITTVSTNAKQIFPGVGAGGTVSQESGKLVVTIPLTTSGSSRNISKRSFSLRTSQRSGVSSEYATSGQWIGVDTTSGKPVYVQSASSGATLVLENAYDNTTNVSLTSGTAELRIGDALPSALSGTVSVSSIPASITMSGSRNLVSLPAYTSIAPASFESQFSSYKAVWVRRSGAWQFYTSSDNKTVYTDKGYTELNSTIEAGEGFWIELNSPVNPANFEVANYGGYTALPQLSSMNSEWNLAGTAKKISVAEITQAANFDQTSEDESNTLGLLDNSGGNGPPSGLNYVGNDYLVAANELGQNSRTMLLLVVLLLTSVSLMVYRRQVQLKSTSLAQHKLHRIPVWQLIPIAALITLVVACAPPQGDSTSSTFDYSGSYDRVHSIWKWDDASSKWLAYSPKTSVALELTTKGYSTFSSVEKGQGYWVRLSISGVPTSLSFAEPPAF